VLRPRISIVAVAQRVEAEDGAQQHRLAGARAADKPDHLATEHVEIELVVHDMIAELGAHAAQSQHDLASVAVIDELARLPVLAASAVIRWPAGR
jgi:hypothetical protein